MGQCGILHEDDRVELLDGELYEMPPIGDGHIGTVNRLNILFTRRLGDRAVVSPQNAIRLTDFSEPQPDFALLRPRADFYESAKAGPGDVFFLVEVADSSLQYDRLTKLPRYAEAGVPEVWIVNLPERRIEVYRAPAGREYTDRRVYARGEAISPLAFPDISIRVEEVLG